MQCVYYPDLLHSLYLACLVVRNICMAPSLVQGNHLEVLVFVVCPHFCKLASFQGSPHRPPPFTGGLELLQ